LWNSNDIKSRTLFSIKGEDSSSPTQGEGNLHTHEKAPYEGNHVMEVYIRNVLLNTHIAHVDDKEPPIAAMCLYASMEDI